ncbi:hypothetical protein Tco_0720934 [Tanacetum coccineum]
MVPLPPRDQIHLWLRYQVEGYTEEIMHDFEDQLETIFRRQVNRVHVLDFEGLTPEMRQDLAERLRMVYIRDDGQEIFDQQRGLHTAEEMAVDGFKAYWLWSERVIPDMGDLRSRHLKRHTKGRKSSAMLLGGHFIRRLAHHFGLVSDDWLRGLSVGAERQPVAAAAALGGAEDAPDIDEGAQAVPAPVHAPPPPPLAVGRTMP